MGDESQYCVRVRGLPWSATEDEISNFFSDCNITGGPDGIHLTKNRDGRASGDAYIVMESKEDVEEALKKDRATMGKRYLEVFEAKYNEMEWILKKEANGGSGSEESNTDGVVRLRGLPFEAGKDEIAAFFQGLEIESNGILMGRDFRGRPNGEAFVQFCTCEGAKRALSKNKQNIGHRYIEVFSSSMDEARRSSQGGGGPGGPMRGGYGGGRPGPYDRQGGFGGGPMARGGGGGYGGGGYGGRGGNFKSFGGGRGNDFANDFPVGGGDGFGMEYGGRGRGGMGGAAGGHIVHMRGLPFRATEHDIIEWFSSVADAQDVCICFGADGRPSGEADIMFGSQDDATAAMTKNKQNMQHRYVELFYDGEGGAAGY